jgi:hypothetical protein
MQEISNSIRIRSVDGIVSTRNSRSTTNVQFAKRTSGYTMTVRLTDSQVTEDGQKGLNIINDLLTNVPLVVALDHSGNMVQIQGFSTLNAKAKSTLPQDVYTRLAPMLSHRFMEAQVNDEWEGRMSLVRGKTLHPGMTWEVTHNIGTEIDTPQIRYSVIWVEGGGAGALSQCVKIRVFTDNDVSDLVKEVRRWIPRYSPPPFFGRSTHPESGQRVTEHTIFWIEPKTMLVRRELARSQVTWNQLPDGTPVPFVLNEQRQIDLIDHPKSN